MLTGEIKLKIVEIAKKYGFKLVVLFGSQATGRVHKKSDVDIGYLSERAIDYRELYDITLELSRIFNNPDIELVNLNNVSPELKKQVADQGIVLHEDNTVLFDLFKVRAHRAYMETKPLRRYRDVYLEKFIQKYA